MRLGDAMWQAGTLVPGRGVQKWFGIAAYRCRKWRVADRAFTHALLGRLDRTTLLHAASTKERLGDEAGRDKYAASANRLHPSPHYDSAAAFAVRTKYPEQRDRVARYLSRRAAALSDEAERRTTRTTGKQYAFVYWDQEEHPDVVRHCIDSMRRHIPEGFELVVLNASTISAWVTIDPRILKLVDIPAHGADIIRLHLLSEYGGLWIDASCLLNDSFPAFFERIRNEDLFVFTYDGSRTGNWFIWAKPGSYRLQLIRSALDSWFLSGRRWTHYFMFHDVVEMLYWTDARYRREWDAGLSLRPKGAFACHKALGRPVTDAEWDEIRYRSPINKLSWRKFNAPALRADPTTGIARLIAEPLGERTTSAAVAS